MSATPAFLPADYAPAAQVTRRAEIRNDLRLVEAYLRNFRADVNVGLTPRPESIDNAAQIVRDIIKRMEV